MAKHLIDVVKIAGADCVKFQKRDIKALLTKEGRDREYNSQHAMAPTYGEHREVMEFGFDEFAELRDYAIKQGLFFTASAWDIPSVNFLVSLGVPFIKIASADLTNIPLLHHIGEQKLPVVISTGMGHINDVRTAHKILSAYNIPVAVLQCTSTYPTAPRDVHLNVIKTYQKEFPLSVIGYSGHAKGFHIPIGAVALGAKIVEKHLTMNQNARGSDHKAALNPSELGHLVNFIRETEAALGSPNKQIQNSEHSCINKLCKSITSTVNIPKGTIITAQMITTKSPGTGIRSGEFYAVLGKVAQCDIEADKTMLPFMVGGPLDPM
jgi:sialic acid synthase SpsE